jgi:5-deoxy-D-glucuronate isomerase
MTEQLLETPPVPGPFFRFTDEAAWITAAKAAGFYTTVTDEEGVESEVLQAYTADHAIDVIGTLYNDDAVYDDDGEVITPATAMAGFHVNYLGSLPDGWEQYEVTPEQPNRKFAGV